MATKTTKRRKGNVTTLDFSGVKSGGASIPDGRYAAKISAVEQKEGKESGEPYTEVTWEITSKKCNGREVKFDNYSHQPQALWRLKSLLEAMEIEVPDGEHDIDWDEMISDETECIIEILNKDSPDGERKYARVVGHGLLSDGGTVDDDEPEESDKPSGKKKPSKDEEEEEDEDDTPPKRRGKKDEEGEDDEEEEERPTSKKLKKGAKVKFKDEKNKLVKGTVDSIDGDQAVVTTEDDDSYEIDVDELTVIG